MNIKSKYGRPIACVAAVIGLLIVVAAVFLVPAVWQRSSEGTPEAVEVTPTSTPKLEQSANTSEGAATLQRSGTQEAETTNREHWLTAYTTTDDLFGFVESALKPALAGDHRAQYLIGQTLATCTTLVVMVNEHAKETLLENIEATLAPVRIDDPARALMAERISRCERFFSANPVSELPSEQQGVGYWLNEALVGRDAFSLIDRAMKLAISEARPSPLELVDRKTAVLNDLREAIRTRDPAVMFSVAAMLTNPGIARDPGSQSAAWFLAACTAGYDCSADNPHIGYRCATTGTCNGGFTIPDQLQQQLTPTNYAAAYAASQEILYKIEAGDWEGLNPYLDLKL